MSNESQTALRALSESQQTRLTELLDEYLCNLEQGVRLDLNEQAASHPELRPILDQYVAKLDALHDLAGAFPAAISDHQPRKLGDFTILQEIGRGGMGTVFEARQHSLDRRVAIKLLPMAAMLDSRQISRFKNESRAAGQLHHPNIVPIHSVGCENGIHFYAMQLIEGISIDAWIRQQRNDQRSMTNVQREQQQPAPFPVERWSLNVGHFPAGHSEHYREIVSWCIAIADALQNAHESGIVHRDVKPSNLMLDHDGKIWITDFGLARCQTDLTLTRSGDVLGTIRYMSPEQAAGKSEMVDHRTDIYSLAATLFEMLTLHVAVEGEDAATLLNRIAEDEPPRLRRFRSDLPADLQNVLQKAMAKRKDDRYESARQFADDLQAVIDGRPTLARPPSIPMYAARWIRRHKRAVLASSSVLAVSIAVLCIIVFQKNRLILENAGRADLYFNQARATVDDLGTRVADKLAEVPGAEAVRQSLLEETLEYYQTFVAEASGDPRLQRKLALTHSRIGVLSNELSGSAQATIHFQKAAEIFDQIGAAGADSARNLNHLALALAAGGAVDQAESIYRLAVSRQTDLLAQDPSDSHLATELALTRNNLGLLLAGLGRRQEAAGLFQDAKTRFTQLIADDPNNLAAVRGISATLSNLSSLSFDADPKRAVPLLKQAIDHQLILAGRSRNRIKASAEIATLYNSLGVALSRIDELSRSEQALSDAIRLQRKLVSISPGIKGYQRELALSLNNLATVQQQRSNHARAAELLREATQCYGDAIDQESAHPAALIQLAAIEHNLAVSLIALDQNEEAELVLKQSIDGLRSRIALSPDPAAEQTQLLRSYSTLLRCQIRDDRWEHARITAGEYRSQLGDVPKLRTQVAEDLAQYQDLANHQFRRRRSQP